MTLAAAASSAVAAWNLNETSGSRADSVGSNTLTDNNTVTSATGNFGNAASFAEANQEYLSCADSAAVSAGDIKKCFRAWVQLASTNQAYGTVLSKSSSSVTDYQILYRPGAGRWEFIWNGQTVVFNHSPSLNTWYLIHAWHDSVANEIGITVNAATASTFSYSGGGTDTGSGFAIGTIGEYVDSDSTWDGLIDDVVILEGYILDATERDEDYNSGTGIAFASWAGGGSPVTATPGVVNLTLTTFAPTVSTPVLCTPGVLALTTTTFAPVVSAPRLCTPGVVALTLTTFAPTVTASAAGTFTPDTATLTLTTFAPTVSAPVTCTPGVAALTISLLQPTVQVPRLVTPSPAGLSITLFAPTILANVDFTPSTLALVLTGYAPTITADAPPLNPVAVALTWSLVNGIGLGWSRVNGVGLEWDT